MAPGLDAATVMVVVTSLAVTVTATAAGAVEVMTSVTVNAALRTLWKSFGWNFVVRELSKTKFREPIIR